MVYNIFCNIKAIDKNEYVNSYKITLACSRNSRIFFLLHNRYKNENDIKKIKISIIKGAELTGMK